ncbi:MAG: PilZ domain-containing protein [Nitrospirae bacterium]|nr:PilZ domain-containing protein [Nitrospirota bacterium]MBI3393212.1 PilZ domain-containing protein [Nitrospirota bacterium]
MEDRRKFRRVGVRLPSVFSVGEAWQTASTRNLSEEGVMSCLPETLPIGTPVQFKIFFPEAHSIFAVTAAGSVVWVDPAEAPGGVRHGIEWSAASIHRGDRQFLKTFVARTGKIA